MYCKLTEETSKINVRVRRNSEVITIPIDEVVVNDIVILSEGDKIPDGRNGFGECSAWHL